MIGSACSASQRFDSTLCFVRTDELQRGTAEESHGIIDADDPAAKSPPRLQAVLRAISLAIALGLAQTHIAFPLSFNQSPTGEETLKLSADLVVVDCLPTQKKTGRIVGGLKRDDLTIYEDGVRQKIQYFSKDKLPVSIVLLVDRAGCVNPFNEQIRA